MLEVLGYIVGTSIDAMLEVSGYWNVHRHNAGCLYICKKIPGHNTRGAAIRTLIDTVLEGIRISEDV
jgi:hypothetical protein